MIHRSDEMDECGPCKYRNENTRAIKYCITCQEPQCQTCSDIHKSSKATRNHFLVHTAEINEKSKTTRDLESFQRCSNHPEKQAEYYCIDHKHMLCSTCLLKIQELDCKAIVEIETVGEQLIKSKFDEQIKTELENTIRRCKNEAGKIQNIKETSRNEKQKIEKIIENQRQKLVSAFDKCEKEILEQIDTNVTAQNLSLNAAKENLTKTLNAAEENKNILQTITSGGSKADVFRGALSVSQQFSDLQKDENTLSAKLFIHSLQSSEMGTLFRSVDSKSVLEITTNVNTKTFTHCYNRSTDIESLLETALQSTLNRDGNLAHDYTCSIADAEPKENRSKGVDKRPYGGDQRHVVQAGNELKTTSQSANAIQTKESEDKLQIVPTAGVTVCTHDGKRPVIVDMVTLKDGCLVLSDMKWSRLIRLNKDLTFKDTSDLSQAPGNMTVLDERLLVVCLPTANRIAFVSVSFEFKWMRNFKTMYTPKGVYAIDTKRLLVSMVDDYTMKWYLYVVTTDGRLLQDIGKSRSILDAGRISSFKLSTTAAINYLHCCKKSNTLFCFEADGTEKFKHNILSPNGTYIDSAGKIFVLSCVGVLHVLSNNGMLLHQVEIPSRASGITCSRTMDSLYISRHDEPFISVFKIKR